MTVNFATKRTEISFEFTAKRSDDMVFILPSLGTERNMHTTTIYFGIARLVLAVAVTKRKL